VIRAGRRGGKSSTLCRVGVVEALFGEYHIPPGDIGVVAIVSVNIKQAAERIRNVEAILKAIGMKRDTDYRRVGDTIELVHRPVKFEVFSATTMASVGFTAICVICDELAIWRNEQTGANPAEQILAWLRPTLATQKSARMFLSSSPFSTLDAHHAAFIAGNTPRQNVAYAPTWVANPTISEADTHTEEPDILEWTRQYKAEPMSAGSLAFFDANVIDECVDVTLKLPRRAMPGDVVTVGADFGFRSDSSALVVAHRTDTIYLIGEILELMPEPNEPLKPSVVVEQFARVTKDHGAEYVMGDNHYRQSISEHLETHDLHFTIAPEGAKGNQEVYVRARRLLLDRQLRLPNNERLLKQLKQVVSQPTAGGGLSIRQPRASGGGHGDVVSAFVLAVWQREGKQIAGSTLKFGTPEYWKTWNSPEAINAREELQMSKEEELAKTEDERPWWDT
jgi:phage terminase large subunit-like protein